METGDEETSAVQTSAEKRHMTELLDLFDRGEPYLRAKLHESDVPRHFHDGLVQYVLHGRLPGGFLTAVLENDLVEACTRADDKNQSKLWNIVFFLYNYTPASCWHGPENVEAWVKKHQSRREAEGATDGIPRRADA
jgi:hypothetical protein